MSFPISNFLHPIVVSEIVSFSGRFSGKNLATSNFLRNFVLENRHKNKQIFPENNYPREFFRNMKAYFLDDTKDNIIKKIAKYIINNIDGYNINEKINNYNSGFINPLYLAIKRGNYYILKLLLEHPNIDVNMITRTGNTTIFAVISIYLGEDPNRNRIFTLFLKHPEIDINDRNRFGQTLLIDSSPFVSLEEFVRLLLKQKNIDVNMQSRAGNTALHRAARYNNVNVVRMLLNHPDINIFVKNNKNESALEVAAKKIPNASRKLLYDEMLKKDYLKTAEIMEKIEAK